MSITNFSSNWQQIYQRIEDLRRDPLQFNKGPLFETFWGRVFRFKEGEDLQTVGSPPTMMYETRTLGKDITLHKSSPSELKIRCIWYAVDLENKFGPIWGASRFEVAEIENGFAEAANNFRIPLARGADTQRNPGWNIP